MGISGARAQEGGPGARMLAGRARVVGAFLVVLSAWVVVGHEGDAFDLGAAAQAEDAVPIDELSDVDTDEDMQSFDNAYDNTLVDKVVDTDFDPDKLFADMEQQGEDQARRHMKTAGPE